MTEDEAKTEIVATAQAMSASGLSPGRSGNLSLRWRDGVLITPSAIPYDQMGTDDVVFVDQRGASDVLVGRPSSEWRFHLAALEARPDRHAVVHTHSLYATALACLGKPIPSFHYMVAVAGGTDIPLVPYALFGTEKLANHVARGLTERDACLLANHGQVSIAKTLPKALALANEVETLAQQYVNVLQVGKPKILSDKAMADVLKQLRNYDSAGSDAT